MQDFVPNFLASYCVHIGSSPSSGASPPACDASAIIEAWHASTEFACVDGDALYQCEPAPTEYVLNFIPTNPCSPACIEFSSALDSLSTQCDMGSFDGTVPASISVLFAPTCSEHTECLASLTTLLDRSLQCSEHLQLADDLVSGAVYPWDASLIPDSCPLPCVEAGLEIIGSECASLIADLTDAGDATADPA